MGSSRNSADVETLDKQIQCEHSGYREGVYVFYIHVY